MTYKNFVSIFCCSLCSLVHWMHLNIIFIWINRFGCEVSSINRKWHKSFFLFWKEVTKCHCALIVATLRIVQYSVFERQKNLHNFIYFSLILLFSTFSMVLSNAVSRHVSWVPWLLTAEAYFYQPTFFLM